MGARGQRWGAQITIAIVASLAVWLASASALAQRRYIVRPGDTLSAIAARHHVGVQTLMRRNALDTARIRPGMRLVIPGRARATTTRAAAARRSRPAHRSSGRDGTHRVRRGDTLVAIARRYDVGVRALRRANRIRSDRIRVGTRLRIPGRGMGRVRAEGAQPPELTEAQQRATERATGLELGTSHTAHRLLTDPPEPEWVRAAPRVSSEGTLASPVPGGRFLRGWGAGARGYHLAVDIGADAGTPIHAAANGIVAYAGNGVRGYGNVVVLVHSNGWVTWYAHNTQNLVVAGQHVARGDTIGTVGDTGFARGPHLHFMLVVSGEHCDAQPLFRPGVDGGNDAQARWTGDRPEEVRCAARAERPHPRRRRNRARRARRGRRMR